MTVHKRNSIHEDPSFFCKCERILTFQGACATRKDLEKQCTEHRTVSCSASRTCCETFGETTKAFYVKFACVAACGNRVARCSRLVRSVGELVQAATFLTCLQEKPEHRISLITCFMGFLYTQRQMPDQYLKLVTADSFQDSSNSLLAIIQQFD